MMKTKMELSWMVIVGATLVSLPGCVDDATPPEPEPGPTSGDEVAPHDELLADELAPDDAQEVLVGDEALAFQAAQTADEGASAAAALVTRCRVLGFTAPAGGNGTMWSCVRSDHMVWMTIETDRPLAQSYDLLSVAAKDVTTGFTSFPRIVAAPNARAIMIPLSAHGMWRAGDVYVGLAAVRAHGGPFSWPLVSPEQRW